MMQAEMWQIILTCGWHLRSLSVRSDLPCQLMLGSMCFFSVRAHGGGGGEEQGGERCQGGGHVAHKTSEPTPSQLHSYLQ